MIEDIREKVVLANNPECKTYEEALENEKKNEIHCEVLFEYEGNPEIMSYSKAKDLMKKNDFMAKGQANGSIKFTVLGLPLTLERVLVTLNKNPKNDVRYFSCSKAINFRTSYVFDMIDFLSEWQPNQTLENQSEETIKAIYNILIKQ